MNEGMGRRARLAMLLLGAAGLGLAACGNSPSGPANGAAANVAEPAAKAASGGACAQGESRLPITGLCASTAIKTLNTAGGTPPEAPEGCEWAVQESRFGEQALLYRAVKCANKTAKLAFQGSGGSAELAYEVSPMGAARGQVLVRIFGANSDTDTESLLTVTHGQINDAAEEAKCSVRKAGNEYWPDDALVVDVGAAEAATLEEPRSACGPYGYDGDSSRFWRVFQGNSWLFDLGQDSWEIDPSSFTLMAKGSDGGWTLVE